MLVLFLILDLHKFYVSSFIDLFAFIFVILNFWNLLNELRIPDDNFNILYTIIIKIDWLLKNRLERPFILLEYAGNKLYQN